MVLTPTKAIPLLVGFNIAITTVIKRRNRGRRGGCKFITVGKLSFAHRLVGDRGSAKEVGGDTDTNPPGRGKKIPHEQWGSGGGL